MDWALIETLDTFSPNRLPYGSAFEYGPIQAPLEILFRRDVNLPFKGFGEVKPREWVAKKGVGGWTEGTINPMEREVQWKPGIVTREFEVMTARTWRF